VDPRGLVAARAAERFAAFPPLCVAPLAPAPEPGAIDLSGGAWRARLFASEAAWPATWPAHERRKVLSPDGARLYKFEGLGRWGAAVRARAAEIARAGFGPPPVDAGAGFTRYPTIAGRALRRGEGGPELVARLADYCAFRAAAFPAPDADAAEIEAMVATDAAALLGRELHPPLPVERPVIADARMHPHEWIAPPFGLALKTDAATHGDDHLFPGPTDVCWDLAGTIVEHALEGAAQQAFLERYRRASGDDAGRRVDAWCQAYRVLSLARAEMAAGSVDDPGEVRRLDREAAFYREGIEW
jgi:hypothetical protein